MLPVPILVYHATNVDGNDYASNDHVAFAHDLRLLDSLGFRIVPLGQVVDALLDENVLPDKAVAITFDDGTDFDYHDLPHSKHGLQRSMLNIMRDFIAERGPARQPSLHATTFVVVSPAAREEMDRKCLAGSDWYRDTWWKPAVASGLLAVANHSWDHNHPTVTSTSRRSAAGTFRCIDYLALADLEIRRARDYIDAVAPNAGAGLFAYPYGDTNDYLLTEYFPLGESVTGARAAFGTQPGHVGIGANRWHLPRYVCGANWHSPEELSVLLHGA